jgi:hypothetical protein
MKTTLAALSGWAALMFFSSSDSAIAGTAQLQPLSYLDTIFNQQSVLDETGGRGIEFTIDATKTIYGPTDNIGGDELSDLVGLSGLSNTLIIPLLYIDSYQVPSTLGLSFVGDNGVTLLTSYQQTLTVHPEIDDYATCTADQGFTCYYIDPEVTPSDIPLGWMASAAVVAHEIGHDLGLQHSTSGLMDPFAPLWNTFDPSDYALSDDQVSTILASRFVQNVGDGGPLKIEIEPFSVLSAAAAVPEPSTWVLAIGGMALAGAALRRRRGAFGGQLI